jgi:hypothetical protein
VLHEARSTKHSLRGAWRQNYPNARSCSKNTGKPAVVALLMQHQDGKYKDYCSRQISDIGHPPQQIIKFPARIPQKTKRGPAQPEIGAPIPGSHKRPKAKNAKWQWLGQGPHACQPKPIPIIQNEPIVDPNCVLGQPLQPARKRKSPGSRSTGAYDARGATRNFRTEVGSSTRRHPAARR